ncbi:CIC11C00000002794 [Sungouiella intermedia]|uniref:CIC11C00000002794 n=1 Tax=Sungouiella intermedia TaxID=45354 RepID=A0A1L0BXK8_9ASCO|nr:CIC11C00000002794 [[Candida] intermedia]
MRFLFIVWLFSVSVWALAVQKEFQSPKYQLSARDDTVRQLKVAKDILGTLKKLTGKDYSEDECDSQPLEDDADKPINQETPASVPVAPIPTSAPPTSEPTNPAPGPKSSQSPKSSPKQKAKLAAASAKVKLLDFIKAKIAGFLSKAKLAAKAMVQKKVNKVKEAAVHKLSPPAKRELSEWAELEESLESNFTNFQSNTSSAVATMDSSVADTLDSRGLEARTLIEDVMTQVFVALKRSGLINYVIRLSLTDEEVRAGVADITIELIRADVIPYNEVFRALQESGLALDVVRFSLTDSDTRLGLVQLVMELVPQLVEICSPLALSQADFSGFAAVSSASVEVSPLSLAEPTSS